MRTKGPLNASMTLWCHASFLWYSCQESMARVWSWGNIRWTQFEDHPREWKLHSMKLSGTWKTGKDRETRRDWTGMATTLNVDSQMGSYTRKEKRQALGQLVKWTVGEIWLGSVDWYINVDFLTGRAIWDHIRQHPCFGDIHIKVLGGNRASYL